MPRRSKRVARFVPASLLEVLETRRLMSAQPNFANFSSTTGLVGDGFGSSAITSGNALQLTDSQPHEARAVWWSRKVGVDHFTTSFAFKTNANSTGADGLTFTIQGRDDKRVGTDGYHLGYTTIADSVAAAFNFWNAGFYGSRFGFATGGHVPMTNSDMSPIDLHSGDTFDVTLNYNGTTLRMTIKDHAHPADTFSQSEQINIPSIVHGDSAYIGFTAGTGHDVATQDVMNWSYSGTANAPTLAAAASASPNPVTETSTELSALGADLAGESILTYTWSTLALPSGAKHPVFTSTNGTNAGKSLSARFSKAGRYIFQCTITNPVGRSITTAVTVRVDQTAHAVRLRPHLKVVEIKQQAQFSGFVVDQFGHTLISQPTIRYSVAGAGSIDPVTGEYVADSSLGHFVIYVKADGLVGTVGGTVVA
jgi:hypothetical protein